MSIAFSAEVIVLKRKNLGETDKIFTFFSKQKGKIAAIAKGVRKINSRKAPHLEVFTHTKLFITSGKTLDIITEAQTIHGFANIRKNLERVVYAYKLVEQIDRLCPENVPHQNIFTDLLQTLELFNNSSELSVPTVNEEFSSRLLSELGYLEKGKNLYGEILDQYLKSILEKELKSDRLLTKIFS